MLLSNHTYILTKIPLHSQAVLEVIDLIVAFSEHLSWLKLNLNIFTTTQCFSSHLNWLWPRVECTLSLQKLRHLELAMGDFLCTIRGIVLSSTINVKRKNSVPLNNFWNDKTFPAWEHRTWIYNIIISVNPPTILPFLTLPDWLRTDQLPCAGPTHASQN